MKLLGIGSVLGESKVVAIMTQKNRGGNISTVRLENGKVFSLKEVEIMLDKVGV